MLFLNDNNGVNYSCYDDGIIKYPINSSKHLYVFCGSDSSRFDGASNNGYFDIPCSRIKGYTRCSVVTK